MNWFLSEPQRHGASETALHEVIEHGDYSTYEALEEDASLVPAAAASQRTYLVFGAIRNKEELEFAERAFKLAQLSGAKLVFAGRLDGHVNTQLAAHSPSEDEDIIRYHRRIANRQVKPLVSASYFVFIPRSDRLNSGVVSLAFTFGIPVVGPNEGVIGELVGAVDNLRFVPGDVTSAVSASQKAHRLPEDEYVAMVDRIRDYRRTHLRWSRVAEKHSELYRRARRRPHLWRRRLLF